MCYVHSQWYDILCATLYIVPLLLHMAPLWIEVNISVHLKLGVVSVTITVTLLLLLQLQLQLQF